MSAESLLQRHELLTSSDHQTHRRYAFHVPEACTQLTIRVRYTPKFVSAVASRALVEDSVAAQRAELANRVGEDLSQRWATDYDGAELTVPNLLTISLDDAAGAYRGAGHRHAAEQHLTLSDSGASPGLYAGPLPAGTWWLTLTAHTLISAQCEADLQIGAEIASNRP